LPKILNARTGSGLKPSLTIILAGAWSCQGLITICFFAAKQIGMAGADAAARQFFKNQAPHFGCELRSRIPISMKN
jgi:hypothetical protein